MSKKLIKRTFQFAATLIFNCVLFLSLSIYWPYPQSRKELLMTGPYADPLNVALHNVPDLVTMVRDSLFRIRSNVIRLREEYFEARTSLHAAHPNSRSHAGVYPYCHIYKSKAFPAWLVAQIVWRRGNPSVNDPERRFKLERQDDKIYAKASTKHIHHCKPGGGYTKRNLRACIKNPWELELTVLFEKKLQKLRVQASRFQAVYHDLRLIHDFEYVEVKSDEIQALLDK